MNRCIVKTLGTYVYTQLPLFVPFSLFCIVTKALPFEEKGLTFSYYVNKGAKIRNRYNQVPYLTQDTKDTQDTNGKVTNSKLDTTNESQEVSPFPADDHKAHINRRSQRHSKHKTEKTLKIHNRNTACRKAENRNSAEENYIQTFTCAKINGWLPREIVCAHIVLTSDCSNPKSVCLEL